MAFLRNQWVKTPISVLFEQGGAPWVDNLVSMEVLDDATNLETSATYQVAQVTSNKGNPGTYAMFRVNDQSGDFKFRVTAPDGAVRTSATFAIGSNAPHQIVGVTAAIRGISASLSNMWEDFAKTTPLGPASGTPQPIGVISDVAGNATDLRALNETTGRPNLVVDGAGNPTIDFGDGTVTKAFVGQDASWQVGDTATLGSSFIFAAWRLIAPTNGTHAFMAGNSSQRSRAGLESAGQRFVINYHGDGTERASFPCPRDTNPHTVIIPWTRFNVMDPWVDNASVAWTSAPNDNRSVMTSAMGFGYAPYFSAMRVQGYLSELWLYQNTGLTSMPDADLISAYLEEKKPVL